MFIYLIQNKETGHFKIGRTKNINKRIKQLQTGSSGELVLVDKFESDFASKLESYLHNIYSGYNIVGKVFNGLKIFVIEDPELIFALSYKSNRNWTLPNYNLDVNANINFGCPDCNIDFNPNVKQPTSINESGSFKIDNIIVTSQPTKILCILNLGNNTIETRIVPIDNSDVTVEFNNLIDGEYNLTVYDLSSSECKKEEKFEIKNQQVIYLLQMLKLYQIFKKK